MTDVQTNLLANSNNNNNNSIILINIIISIIDFWFNTKSKELTLSYIGTVHLIKYKMKNNKL